MLQADVESLNAARSEGRDRGGVVGRAVLGLYHNLHCTPTRAEEVRHLLRRMRQHGIRPAAAPNYYRVAILAGMKEAECFKPMNLWR